MKDTVAYPKGMKQYVVRYILKVHRNTHDLPQISWTCRFRNLHLPREGFFTLAKLAQLIDPETHLGLDLT